MAAPTWVDFYNQLMGNAQQYNSVKKNDANFGIHYSSANADIQRAKTSGKGGSKSDLPGADKLTNLSVGKRIMDILMRGNYASAAFQQHMQQNESDKPGFNPLSNTINFVKDLGDIPGALGAAGQGFAGKKKVSYSDVNKEALGTPTSTLGKIGLGALNFAEDVALDPTTYIGAGAVKGLIRGGSKAVGIDAAEKAIKSTRLSADAVKPPVQRAVDEMATTGKATVPVKSVDDFIKDVTRNVEQPGQGVFDAAVKTPIVTKQAPIAKRIADEETYALEGEKGLTLNRQYPERITNPALMLGGTPAPVITERASMAKLDALAKGIPQFDYGRAVDQLDTTGPFRQTTERIPLNNVPQVRPKGTAEKAIVKAGEFAEPKTSDVTANTVLRRLDEPVYSEYVIKTDSNGLKFYQPAEGSYPTTVRELRQIAEHGTDVRARSEAHRILKNHIDTIRSYGKYLETKKLSTLKNYLKGQYPTEFEAARVATGGRKKAAGIADLPAGPAEKAAAATPTFKEIQKIEKMDFIDREIYFENMRVTAGLSDSDMAYLRSASNPKSFATRLAKIQTRLREGGVKDVADLIDAIKTGRIQAETDPEIQAFMQAVGVKSLKSLVTKLEQAQGRLSKAEQKMLGNIKEGAITKETVEKSAAAKELGPTGLPYKPYMGKAQEALNRAKDIINKKVEPAAKIAEDVKNGDKAAITRPVTELNVNQGKMFDHAMRAVAQKNVISQRDKSLWAYLTKRGTLKNNPHIYKGDARNKGAWNKYVQYDLFKNLMNNSEKLDPEIKAVLDAASVRGADRSYLRASAMHEVMMPVMRAVDEVLKQGGIFPVGGKGVSDNPFSLFDVLSSMSPDFVKRNIFTMRKTKTGAASVIAPTQLMDAVNYLVDVMKTNDGKFGPDDIENVKNLLLEQQVTTKGNKVPNALRSRILKMKDPQAQANAMDEIVSEIADGMPELFARVERNTAERSIYHENKIVQGTKESLETLADVVMNPKVSMADITGLSSKIDVEVVGKISRLRGIDPNDEFAVRAAVTEELPSLGITPEMQAQGYVMNQMAGATTAAGRTSAMHAQSKIIEEQTTKLAEEVGIPLTDLGAMNESRISYRVIKAFAPHYGNKDVRPFFLDRKSATQAFGRSYQGLLSDINKNHSKDNLLAAWKELQHGSRSADENIAAAQDDLQNAIHAFFTEDPNYNVFHRNNVSAADVNAHAKHFGIHEKYWLEDEGINDIWRTWDTDNPLDLLARMQAATMAATSKRLLGEDLSRTFGSATKQEGFVKLSPHKSVIGKYIDTDMYYPRDVAKQFKILDDFIKESMEPSKFNPVVNLLDSVLHSYKAGLTIYRPGHHVRNMVGDVWLAHMAGVNNPKYYTKAAKLMAQNHGRYRDFDALNALIARQPVNVQGGKFIDDGSPVVHVRINGKMHALSGGEVYRAAYDHGILPDYRTLEDIQMGTESMSTKFKPFGGKLNKLNKAASSFSEARDHYVRLAHFMNDLEKGGYKSLEEAVAKSAHNVRKWHPDGSDLTHFEAKFMRRTFLFYSWIRKAMPLVVESMVMKPGKVSMYPKAMYNIAEANGIDLDSMSNPFPQDQLFPDWITDSPVGPIMQNAAGHYLGINPGVPAVDVINDYAGGQAGRTALGSLNPFVKIPLEISLAQNDPAVAQDVRTGIKSYDMSDYIDRQIPFGTYLTGITGRSPSSGFTQVKGNKQDSESSKNAFAFSNLLSGMGLFDMSKPSYQRQAVKDAKARLNQGGR